jgi:hypothetical protein
MAAEDDLRRLIEVLERNSRGSGNSAGTTTDGAGSGTDNLIAKAKKTADALDRMQSSLNLTVGAKRKYRDAVYSNTRMVEDLEEELEKLKIGIKKTGDENLKAKKKEVESLLRNSRVQEESAAAGQAFNGIVNRLAGTIKSFGSQIISSQTAVVSAIQSGASGFGIAGEVLNQQAQIQNMVFQGIASAAQAASVGLAAFGAAGVAAGVVINALAAAASVYSELATQLEINRNRLITTEADKMLTAFKGATSAGAIMAGGANQMLESLQGTVYVLGDYEAAVKRNSKALAENNIGVGEASMLFGGVSRRLGAFQKGLLAVGIGYETQLDIIAQSAANISAAQPDLAKQIGREAFEVRVTEHTKKYATELARLSALTGESADSLAKKKAADEQEAAFQGFLRELGSAGPGVLEAFSKMPVALQKYAFETAKFGGPITQSTALFGTLNPVLAQLGQQYGNMARSGTLNVDSMIEVGKASAEAARAERDRSKIIDDVGYIAKGAIGETQNAAEGIYQFLRKLNGEGDAAVTGQIEAGQAGRDGADASRNLTAEFANMEEAGRALRVEIQQKVLGALGPSFTAFYEAIAQASKYIDDVLGKNIRFPTGPLDKIEEMGNALIEKTKLLGFEVDEWVRLLRLSNIAIGEFKAGLGVPKAPPGEKGPGSAPRVTLPEPPKDGKLPSGYRMGPGGILVPDTPAPKAPAPSAPSPATGSWWDSAKQTLSDVGKATSERVNSAMTTVGSWMESARKSVGQFVDDMGQFGKVITGAKNMIVSVVETFAKWLGKLAAPITAAFSGWEAFKDINSYLKGQIGGFDLAKKLTSNIVSTVSAFIISGLVAAGVTTVTAPTGPAAPVAGVAAGIGTYLAVDSFMRWMIDNGFELVRPAGSQPPAQQQNQNRTPVPTAPSAVPELTPQSSVVVPNSPVQVGSINKSVNMSPVAMKINSNSPEQLAATNTMNQKLDMLATAMNNNNRTQLNLEQLLANQLEVAISQRDNTSTLVGYNSDQADYLRGINRSMG